MRVLLLLLALAGGLVGAQNAIPIPEPFGADRYSQMLERSPFALATPVAAPEAPKENFATNLYISGLVIWGPDDVHSFVSVRSRDLATQFTLDDKKPGPDGITLHNIEVLPGVGKSIVTLAKGGEFGRLEFNQADVQAPAVAQPGSSGAPGQPQPGGPVRIVPPNNPNGQRTPGGNRASIPPPRPGTPPLPGSAPQNRGNPTNSGFPSQSGTAPQMRGNPANPIPRPGANAIVPPANATLQPGAAPIDARRRVRVINSAP